MYLEDNIISLQENCGGGWEREAGAQHLAARPQRGPSLGRGSCGLQGRAGEAEHEPRRDLVLQTRAGPRRSARARGTCRGSSARAASGPPDAASASWRRSRRARAAAAEADTAPGARISGQVCGVPGGFPFNTYLIKVVFYTSPRLVTVLPIDTR